MRRDHASHFARPVAALAAALALISGTAAAAVANAPSVVDAAGGRLSAGMIFTCFMVMVGPVKIILPFHGLTSAMDQAAARNLALKGFAFSCIGGAVAAISGVRTLESWGISPAALHFAAGLVLLLVALRTTVAQYHAPTQTNVPSTPPASPALAPLTFPMILTPYGIAALILLCATSSGMERTFTVIGLFLLVMVINLVVMWFVRPIVRHGGIVLMLLGAVLAVLQVALATQMIAKALHGLHVLYG